MPLSLVVFADVFLCASGTDRATSYYY